VGRIGSISSIGNSFAFLDPPRRSPRRGSPPRLAHGLRVASIDGAMSNSGEVFWLCGEDRERWGEIEMKETH
jgi:hypothetical protein